MEATTKEKNPTLYLNAKALLQEIESQGMDTVAIKLDCESGELDISFLKLGEDE